MLIERELLSEDERVVNFKLEWLLAAGYKKKNAMRIASDPNIDWHFAVSLRKECNSEDLCMRILAPSKLRRIQE